VYYYIFANGQTVCAGKHFGSKWTQQCIYEQIKLDMDEYVTGVYGRAG